MTTKDNNFDLDNAYGEDTNSSENTLQEKLQKAKNKKSRLTTVKADSVDAGVENIEAVEKKGTKEKRKTNSDTLAKIGLKQNNKTKEKANVYLKENTMNKLKTLSSTSNTSLASLIELFLEKALEDVEVIEDEVRKYNKKNEKRKRS